MAAPTVTDLAAFLVACDIIASVPESGTEQYTILTRALAVSVQRFSEETGWDPFESESQTRKFTLANGNLLILDQGLLEVTELLIGTTAYVEDEDFWLLPANAILDGKCATMIEFNFNVTTARNGLTIEGNWGRMSAYGNAEKDAILAGAAIIAGANLQGISGVFGPVVEFVKGEVKQKLKDDTQYGLFDGWARTWKMVVDSHARHYV